jgi:hypothetical protein
MSDKLLLNHEIDVDAIINELDKCNCCAWFIEEYDGYGHCECPVEYKKERGCE